MLRFGVCKAGYATEGRATLTVLVVQGCFSLWVWGYYRDGRQKLGGGVPPLQSLSAGSGALWMENVGGGGVRRRGEGKGEKGSIRESSLCLLASGGVG